MSYEFIIDEKEDDSEYFSSGKGFVEIIDWAKSDGGPLMKSFAETYYVEDLPAFQEEIRKTIKEKKNIPKDVLSTIKTFLDWKGSKGRLTDGINF